MTRVLVLGELSVGQTTRMRMRALERLGYEVAGLDTVEPWKKAGWLQRQMQRRLEAGSVVDNINRQVVAAAGQFRPDWVWAEKQEYLRPETLRALRHAGARVVHFTPDPYFSLEWKRTRIMDETIREFDVLVYCKSYEEAEYRATGSQVAYMPLGYCQESHRPTGVGLGRPGDVAFLGGWEPRRQSILRACVGAGLKVRIWGRSWECFQDGRWSLRRHVILRQLAGGQPYTLASDKALADSIMGDELYGTDYAQALGSSTMSIGFLRTICPDQHTTRTFEIPACGTLLLADRSDEHRELFEEGHEAEFFSSEEECVDKAHFYAERPSVAQKLAQAGRARCLTSGYDYQSRMRVLLNQLGLSA